MFELLESAATSDVEVSTLDPRSVLALQRELTAALEMPSGLDDAGRIDALRALEQLGCVVSAAQAHLAVELDASQRERQEAAGSPTAAAAVAAWPRRSRGRAGSRPTADSATSAWPRWAPAELPQTWRAWREGRITEWKATLIARETACLSRDDRGAVDLLVAGDGARLESLGERELVSAVQAEAYRLDPASFVARRRRAEADRHVTLRPAPDTMTWLTALLPVKDGVAAYAALSRAADTARASGDPRSRGQVMADGLVGPWSPPGRRAARRSRSPSTS